MKKLTAHSLREKDSISLQNDNKFSSLKIISKNLQKYKTTKKQYDILITNAIIFDQRNHKVAEFKNYLLWDECSEFLKRFYKLHESTERIPKISEYYEKYTLFAPIYFGLDGLIIIIMNKWTKRKKNYLEYIEDHEDDSNSKSKLKDWNFDPIIKPSLLGVSESKSKSVMSKNTLELEKCDIENNNNNKNKQKEIFNSLITNKDLIIPGDDSKKNIKNKNEKNIKNDEKEKDKVNSKSFSEILDDLSSNYSAFVKIKEEKIYSKKNNNKNYTANNNKLKSSTSKKIINKCFIFTSNNNKNISENNFSVTNNFSKKKNTTSINFPPSLKRKKMSLTKKAKNYQFTTTAHNNYFNQLNIVQRNKSNNSDIKKYEKLVMNTDNAIYKLSMVTNSIPLINSVRDKKTVVKINHNSNLINDVNKFGNNILKNHHAIDRLKKNNINSNNVIESFSKKYIYPNYFSGNGSVNIIERNGKNQNLTNLKTKNTVCNINSLEIKKNYFSNLTHNITNSDSYSKKTNKSKFTHNRKNNNFPLCYLYDIPKNEIYQNGILVTESFKKINRNENNGKFSTDPLINKILKISNNNNKKKQLCLTAANSLHKIKEGKKFAISHYNSSNSSAIKVNSKINKKNFVMNRFSKKEIVFDNNKKKNINNVINHECLTSKNCSNSIKKQKRINLQIPKKIPESQTFRQTQKKNSQKINLNLNLNIHFDIDMEKTGNKKLIFNNAIINQQNQHIINTRYPKYNGTSNMKKRINSIKLISTLKNNYTKNINKITNNRNTSRKRTNNIIGKEKEK